jgi:hypothetical protein
MRALRALIVLMLLITATSCDSGTARARGSLMLSGAITSIVTAGNQDTGAGCAATTITTGLPPTTPPEVALTGTVDFSSGTTSVALRFMGAPATFNLPLPGELQVPGPPGFVEVIANGSGEWSAGQSSPTSSGTLTLSKTTSGAIHGSVDAILAPLRATTTPLHIVGTWTC